MMKHIASFSGGKDSTAMILKMLEKNMIIDEIIHFSMGEWDWEQIKEHIIKFEKYIGQKITILEISDLNKRFRKYGFPNMMSRWCTDQKKININKYLKEKYGKNNYIQYIGITANEERRTKKTKYNEKFILKYPLFEWGITEKDSLEICYEHGFDFGGLYELLPVKRVSCWCCPLQGDDNLRALWLNFPEKWDKLREMQKISKTQPLKPPDRTVFHYEHKFYIEQYYGWKLKRKKEQNSTKQLELF